MSFSGLTARAGQATALLAAGLWCGLLLVGLGRLPAELTSSLIIAVTALSALAVWLRVAAVPTRRAAWAAMAFGLSGYAVGWGVLFHVSMGEGGGPFGMNWSDCASLLVFPAGYLGVALLAGRRAEQRSGDLLEASSAVLACAALALALAAHAAPALLQGSALHVLYVLGYPAGGASLVLGVVAVLALRGWRVDATWWLLLAGFGSLTVGDVVFATRSAAGTFSWGTWLDAVYVGGPLLVAVSASVGARPALPAGQTATMVVPGVATLAALLVLVDEEDALPRLATLLAALVVVVAGLRGMTVVRSERLLATRTEEARTDPLTGLGNRRALAGQLAGPQDGAVLLLLVLDGFDRVNATLGHDAGDRYVRVCAERLVELVGQEQAARLDGARFAVVLPPEQAEQAQLQAARLVRELSASVLIDGCAVTVAVTAGIAEVPAADGRGEVARAQEAVRRADVALAAATVTVPVVRWDTARDDEAREHLVLISELRTALADGDQLVVHVQPQFDPRTRGACATEALVRWQHPTRGLLGPGAFLPAVEEAGLLSQLTEAVLDAALRQLGDVPGSGLSLPVSVNVGSADLLDRRFPARVVQALERHGVDPHMLRLEVTETAVMTDPVAVSRALGTLRAVGVGLSLDDFGTGLSSLTYLRDLPVDELKVDRSLCRSCWPTRPAG